MESIYRRFKVKNIYFKINYQRLLIIEIEIKINKIKREGKKLRKIIINKISIKK
jgi:hypothetical protein